MQRCRIPLIEVAATCGSPLYGCSSGSSGPDALCRRHNRCTDPEPQIFRRRIAAITFFVCCWFCFVRPRTVVASGFRQIWRARSSASVKRASDDIETGARPLGWPQASSSDDWNQPRVAGSISPQIHLVPVSKTVFGAPPETLRLIAGKARKCTGSFPTNAMPFEPGIETRRADVVRPFFQFPLRFGREGPRNRFRSRGHRSLYQASAPFLPRRRRQCRFLF